MTIYEEIGGLPAMASTDNAFYDRITVDSALINYMNPTILSRSKHHGRAPIGTAPELFNSPSCPGVTPNSQVISDSIVMSKGEENAHA